MIVFNPEELRLMLDIFTGFFYARYFGKEDIFLTKTYKTAYGCRSELIICSDGIVSFVTANGSAAVFLSASQ